MLEFYTGTKLMPDMFTQFIGLESLYEGRGEGFKKDLILRRKHKRLYRKPLSPNLPIGSNLSNLDLTIQTSAQGI